MLAEVDQLVAERSVEQRRVELDRKNVAREEELLALLEREVDRLEDLSRDRFATPAELERAQRERTRQRQALAEQRLTRGASPS